ncbi:hypothetical protein BFS86_19525 [Shewanella algae]|nr:hypothetical protein BFS86_19525 [Shewanella algae]DAU40286.1 MAG TPA: hypothetical protein [Caudoviricetes sp.]
MSSSKDYLDRSVDHAHDAVVKACSEYARLTCEDDMLDLIADIHMQYAKLTKDDVVKGVYDLIGIDVVGGNGR